MIYMESQSQPPLEIIVKPNILLEKTLKKIDRFTRNKHYLVYVLRHYRNHSHIPSLEGKESDELQRAVIRLIDMGLLTKKTITSAEVAFDRRYNISITRLGTDVLEKIDKDK